MHSIWSNWWQFQLLLSFTYSMGSADLLVAIACAHQSGTYSHWDTTPLMPSLIPTEEGQLVFLRLMPSFVFSIAISLWAASSLALEVLSLLDTFRAAVIKRARTRPPCGGNRLKLWRLPWVLWQISQAQAVSLLFITEMSPFKPAIRGVQVRADSPVA